jgi:DNA-binding transcriptional ArsR family regulator
MLRLHFTGEDLGRVRVAASADPLWEVVLSLHRLRTRDGSLVFDGWRRRVREDLIRAGLVPPVRSLLFPLNPPAAYFPDFLTPAEAAGGLDAGLDAVASTPRRRLSNELERLAAGRRLPEWGAKLARGDLETVTGLREALLAYHRVSIAPYWSHIQRRVDAERAARARAALDGGAGHLLASLRPILRWDPPVLEADYPVRRDLHLGGRGLLLIPSLFCWRRPVMLADTELPPVLVYPVEPEPSRLAAAAPERPAAGSRPLVRLLGRTRATALEVIAAGCTTTELARRLGVSAASASEHATTLREAGLVYTRRHGSAVLHTLTPLGTALLDGTHGYGAHPRL